MLTGNREEAKMKLVLFPLEIPTNSTVRRKKKIKGKIQNRFLVLSLFLLLSSFIKLMT